MDLITILVKKNHISMVILASGPATTFIQGLLLHFFESKVLPSNPGPEFLSLDTLILVASPRKTFLLSSVLL